MENQNLEFLDTMTVDEFKAEKGVASIQVVRNPHTGKLFFMFGKGKADRGPVAKAGLPKSPVISYVKGEPTEENPSGLFYLMHEASANIVLTL